MQWVPSHVGVEGNEQADRHAAKVGKCSLRQVTIQKEVTDIWSRLGLEVMPDALDSDSDISGGSRVTEDDSLGEEVQLPSETQPLKRPKILP